jgi:hypothetical protein
MGYCNQEFSKEKENYHIFKILLEEFCKFNNYKHIQNKNVELWKINLTD